MGRVSGARCDDCRRVKTSPGTWSRVWAGLKSEGWTVDRGTYRCPECAAAWKRKLDGETTIGQSDGDSPQEEER